ncbi:MAG: Gfo/Idh/MocA family protein [Flavobacteriales bacterium]
MGKIRFSVIGAGHIGKRHAEMVMRNDEAELVSMCDLRTKEETGTPYDVPYFQDAQQLFSDGPETDVVCICTPNGSHAEYALQALKHGKHVVIEKPMALGKADGEKVIYEALRVNKQVFCVMQNRYSPPSEWIKGILDQGILGKVYMVNVNCHWNRDDRYYKKGGWKGLMDTDGGTLFTQFSHFLDIMYWLFGDIQHIHSRFADFNHESSTQFEDSGLVSFEFCNGGLGTINFTTAVWDTNFESSLTIIAEKGTVKLGGQYMNEVEYCHIQDYTMPVLPPSNPANDYGAYKGSAANHGYVIQNTIDTLKGRTNITTNALEGLKVVDIIERIYQSAQRPLK